MAVVPDGPLGQCPRAPLRLLELALPAVLALEEPLEGQGWSRSAGRDVQRLLGPFAVAKVLVAGRPDRRCAPGGSLVALECLPGLAGALLERVLAASAGRWRLGQDARRPGVGAAPAGVAAGLLELLEPPLLAAKGSAEAAGDDPDASRAIAGAVGDQPATTSGAVAALTARRAALRSRGVRPPHMPSPSAAARHSALTVQPAHSARAAV